MPKHDKGLDHHMCSPKTKVAFLAFNHHKEWYFTLSKSCTKEHSFCWNNLAFFSFHKTQTVKSQINCKKDLLDFKPPGRWNVRELRKPLCL